MGFSLISGAEILFHVLASVCKDSNKEQSESQKQLENDSTETEKGDSGDQTDLF